MSKKTTTTKVTKTASATKVLKTTKAHKETPMKQTPKPVRVKKVNKMVEIVNKAKENGFVAVVVGKRLKTMTCKNCNKQAGLFTNNKITVLACICGHRRLIG